MTTQLLSVSTWALMTIAVDLEAEVCFPRGYWVYKFLWLLAFASATVHAPQVIALAEPTLVMVPYIAQWVALGVLALLAVFHWPKPQVQHSNAGAAEEQYSALDTRVRAGACPQATAGWWSKITWNWVQPLIDQGYRRPLVEEDVWDIDPKIGAKEAHATLTPAWQEQQAQPKPSLLRALSKVPPPPPPPPPAWLAVSQACARGIGRRKGVSWLQKRLLAI